MNELQKKPQKRIVTIQDIACYGRCSLTIALPIISAAGVEVCPVPTSVLSTHTGGFCDIAKRDLSEDIPKIANHWLSFGLRFDAIYTGYIANERQIQIVDQFVYSFKTSENFVIIDPAMADNGKLYSGFDDTFVDKMHGLCKKADILIPNLTEAAFLAGESYCEDKSYEYASMLAKKLSKKLNIKTIVITGVLERDANIGAAVYDKQNDSDFYVFTKKESVNFHGTGDIFSSVFASAMVRGISLLSAAQIAVDFTSECIRATSCDKTLDPRGGVRFELCLKSLIEMIDRGLSEQLL